MQTRPPTSTDQPPPVLLTRAGNIAHIRLNRPDKINALTEPMTTAIGDALDRWRSDDAVLAVLIDGAGERGLCAGGDIAAVYYGIKGSAPHPSLFWRSEYRMNLLIAEYPKPVVTIMDGLTFGGGVGISAHASLRVVTETTQIAMPETAIGLSPDVGGLHLLARMPGETGTHAALTGARLGAGDALLAGFADVFVPRARLSNLRAALAAVDNDGDLPRVVANVATDVTSSAVQPWVEQHRTWIDDCYRGDEAGEIYRRLAAHREPAANQAANQLSAMSPTAVSVALRALRNAASMTLKQVLEQDFRLSMACARHPDFPEGIRAQIIDKDKNPRWRPPELADIRSVDVDAFFA